MSAAALKASLALWHRRLAFREQRLKIAQRQGHHDGKLGPSEVKRIQKWKKNVAAAEAKVSARTKQIAAKSPLRIRAHAVAVTLIGVMEQGGNNVGPMVTKIIRANRGTGPEPWCSDFQAYCYKLAGSKSIQRAWASVAALAGLAGIRRTSHPLTGDLVRYTFSHVGMFERDNGDGTITTIEGNTGASGAVSDSATGGDGVYRKVRSKDLVRDYLRVLR